MQRLVHISSLAAAGPAAAREPCARRATARTPSPNTAGASWPAELEVRDHCRAEYVILRPLAVYGPRDAEFLRCSRPSRVMCCQSPAGAQALSLVFVRDLAEAVATCLTPPGCGREDLLRRRPGDRDRAAHGGGDCGQMATWALPLPCLPLFLWPVCAGAGGLVARDGQAQRSEPAEIRRADARPAGFAIPPSWNARRDTPAPPH